VAAVGDQQQLVIVFAHAGHWAPDLAIYVGPIAIVGIGLWIADRREKRRRAREGDG
jgi:hypothetical protein